MSWWLETANNRPASPLRGEQAPSSQQKEPRGVQVLHLSEEVTLTVFQQREGGWRAKGVRVTRQGAKSWPASPRGESSDCSPA